MVIGAVALGVALSPHLASKNEVVELTIFLLRDTVALGGAYLMFKGLGLIKEDDLEKK